MSEHKRLLLFEENLKQQEELKQYIGEMERLLEIGKNSFVYTQEELEKNLEEWEAENKEAKLNRQANQLISDHLSENAPDAYLFNLNFEGIKTMLRRL